MQCEQRALWRFGRSVHRAGEPVKRFADQNHTEIMRLLTAFDSKVRIGAAVNPAKFGGGTLTAR